jgi:hypothetical protein
MVTAFDALCARFPELQERCSAIAAQWDSGIWSQDTDDAIQ